MNSVRILRPVPDKAALLGCAALLALLTSAAATAQTLSPPLPDVLSKGLEVSNPTAEGYVAQEYLLRGTAPVLMPVTMADAKDTNAIDNAAAMRKQANYVQPIVTPSQPYVVRVIVYRPKDPSRFTGNVIVETMHPAGGGRAIVWSSLNPFFMRRGDAYVIVQHPVTFEALRKADPARYGSLSAKDPTQVWGMLTDVGRLLKTSGIGGLKARYLFMTGYSYTGVATATFADYHHNSSRLANGKPIYDAYFPMAAGMYVRDLDVPVMTMMTNSDFNIFDSVANRKPDSDAPDSRYRRYEIAGASHSVAPTPEAGEAIPPRPLELPEARGLPQFSPQTCFSKFPSGYQPNDFPTRLAEAALFQDLIDWVTKGTPPPPGASIETGADNQPKLDSNGNALGGVRLPPITVPTKTYGMGQGNACFIFGYTLPLSKEKLKSMYGSRIRYVAKLRAAARKMVARRLLLPEGASELVSWAELTPKF